MSSKSCVPGITALQHNGVNVIGYVCRSIASNRDWGRPFGNGGDFGLYHIDLDTDPDLKRTTVRGRFRE